MTIPFSSMIEIAVVVLGLLYVILIAFEKRIGWIAGAVGSGLFVISNLQQHLYMDSILNSYYVLAGLYGWYIWGGEDKGEEIPIIRISTSLFLGLLIFSALLTVGSGILLSYYTTNALPYLDAGVTILSFLATWMATRKYIENWIVWLVADPMAMVLYAVKGGWLYPVLFGVYTIMAIYGYMKWKKHLNNAV